MAGRIPQHFIDELLARVDVVDVVDSRVVLKKAGRDHMACCPFHDEKTPSFSVSQSKQFYHCFGCGASGNAIGFLMEYESMHFVDAVEALAESVGLDVPRDEQAAKLREESLPLYAVLEKAAQFYRQGLRDAPAAIDYLKRRGLSGATAKRFGLGYAPDGWDALQTALGEGERANLVATGMLVPGKDGGRSYQRFRDRVMFPIRDRRGRVIAFGGRVLGDAEPKYLNSPETPLFHKGRELYGLHEARRAAQESGTVIVVEGYMDVVALAHHGIDNAVATLGTAANREHSEALFRTVPNVVFCFDGDRAGRAAAARALLATLPSLSDGRDARFLFLPEGEDPDSIVRARGASGFTALLGTDVPIIDFLHEHLAIGLDTRGIGGKAQLAERARPLLATIPPGVIRELATRRFEQIVGVPLAQERHAARPATRPAARETAPARPVLTSETVAGKQLPRALMCLLQYPSVVLTVPPEKYEFDDSVPGTNVLIDLICFCEREPEITTARLVERFRDTPYHERLAELATTSPLLPGIPFDLDVAKAEFGDCVEKLGRLGHRRRQLVDTVSSARLGLMSINRS